MCNFPDSGHASATWLLKQVGQQMSANKTNSYWPNWVETFQKWKAEAMTLGKKGKGMRENFNLIQLPKPHFVKRGDLCQLQGCRGQLKLYSKKKHDLHCRE